MRLLKLLVSTDSSLAALIVRLTVGGVMLPHGLQKTVGAFGGYGFSGTMGFFTGTLQLPWIVAFLVIIAESLGAVALLAGFLTRFCAFSIILVMVGAITIAHWNHEFFMNWFGAQQGEGFEYHLLVIGAALSLLVSGGGRFSVDRMLQDR